MDSPGVDHRIHNAIVYTMATCHSLREVDGELIGDPLDLKMFQFTGWLFKEGNHESSGLGGEQDSISPSIARPPEMEILSNDGHVRRVGSRSCYI
jgi:cation-transporting ATPase 13A2